MKRVRVLVGVACVVAILAVLGSYFGWGRAKPSEPAQPTVVDPVEPSASALPAERVPTADPLASAKNARSWPGGRAERYPPVRIATNRDTPLRAVLDLGNEVLLVDLEHGRTVTSWSADGGSDAVRVALAGGIVVVAVSNELRAVDTDGRPLWTRQDSRVSGTEPLLAARVRDVLLLGGASDEVVALDASTGAERWRASVQSEGALASDGDSFYVGSNPSGLEARNPATGAVRFRGDCDPEHPAGRGPASCDRVSIDEGKIAAVGRGIGYSAVWDTATGRLLRSLDPFAPKLGFTPVTGLVTGSSWILAGTDWLAPGSNGTNFIELDVAGGERRYELALEPVVEVVRGEGEVFARSAHGTLYRIRDGRVVSRWGFHGGQALAVVGPWLILDENQPSRIVAVHRDEMPDPGPTIRVKGTARHIREQNGDIDVVVGERVVRARADGTFEAEIATRGVVRVSVKQDHGGHCDRTDDAFVDGTSPMPIAVQRVAKPCMNL